MDYLAHHDRIEYLVYDTELRSVMIPDVWKRAVIKSYDDSVFMTVFVSDNERPDQLANRLYDNHRLWWTFFYVNDKLMEHGWPLSFVALSKWIDERWGKHKFDVVRFVDKNGTLRETQVLPEHIMVNGEIVDHWINHDLIASTSDAETGVVEEENWYADSTDNIVVDGSDDLVFSDEAQPSSPARHVVLKTIRSITPEDEMTSINENLKTIRAIRPEFMQLFLNDYSKAIADGTV